METYRLIVAPSAGDTTQPTEIASGNALSALLLAQRHAGGRPVEVWRGKRLICRIAESVPGGFWEVT
jgi:hypothetical protein